MAKLDLVRWRTLLGFAALIFLLSLLTVSAQTYNEAPMLAERVESGELPPVEERLPLEPLVIEPLEQIGTYGGTLRAPATEPTSWANEGAAHMRIPYMLTVTPDVTEVIPYFAKGYELADDAMSLTLYLREGMKWSDGHPFTVDDILFWWEDQIQNAELTPVVPIIWRPGGELTTFEKVDDYTLRMSFAVPYRPILSYVAYWGSQQGNFFQPRHYLENWHIDYNENANELAQEEGFEFWYQAFLSHADNNPSQQDVNLPTLSPWMLVSRTPSRAVYERNPYFLAVDPEGNQLPYIDRVTADALEREVLVIRLAAGELDYGGQSLVLTDLPVLRQSQDQGDYRLLLWPSPVPAEIALAFNLNHNDPALREIFQDVRFRRAMSLGINRDEINDLVFLGLGTPMQATVHPSNSYFKEEWARAYADYDPDTANQLLDEMGLERGPDGIRRRPDGQPLRISIDYSSTLQFATETMELVQSYWQDLGINTATNAQERSLYYTRAQTGELDVGSWHTDRMMEFRVNIPNVTKWNGLSELGYAVDWQQWLNTDGEAGEEAAGSAGEAWFAFMDMLREWYTVESEEDYMRLAEEIWDNQAENLWVIGTVGLAGRPMVAQNAIGNFPEERFWGDDTSWWRTASPEQWYLDR